MNIRKNKIFFSIFILFFCTGLVSTGLNDGVKAFEANKFRKSSSILSKYTENPKNSFLPKANYYLGKALDNGQDSFDVFRTISFVFPNTVYADDSCLRVSDYLYLSQSFISSTYYLKRIAKQYSDSNAGDDALFRLGMLYANRKDFKMAKRYLDKVIKTSKSAILRTSARINLAEIYIAQKKYKEAEKILKKFPDDAGVSKIQIYTILNQLYTKWGKPKQAEKYKLNMPTTMTSVPGNSNKYFTIQIGTFSIEKNADRLKSEWEKRGHTSFKEERIIKGKKYYIIYVGKFGSKNEAEKLLKKHPKDLKGSIIKPYTL